MKYLTLIIMTGNLSLAQATDSANWQEHGNYYLTAQTTEQPKGTGAFVTVGSDNACDYRVGGTKIQDAIDDGHAELRIVTDTYQENLTIDDRSIALYGGYADCTAAAADQSDGNQVVVDAGGTGVVLAIPATTQRQLITIKNMNFTNGLNGMAATDADVEISLTHVWFSNNHGGISSGGGMAILGGNTDILGTDLLIASNTAWFGGGLLCGGANNSVLINKADNFAGISLNQATNGDGGAAWITDGCVLSIYAGTNFGFPDLSGITGNSATNHGGGVAVTNGGKLNLMGSEFCFGLNCIGSDDEPVNLTSNQADSDENQTGNGGAVYVDGENSEVYALTVDVNNNKAFNGGGFAAENDGYLQSYHQKTQCWSPGSCNQINNNEATNVGGAMYVSSDSTVEMGPSHIYQNRAEFGTAGFITGANSQLQIEGSVIFENGESGSGTFADNTVFLINGTPTETPVLLLIYNTIADNQATGVVVRNFYGLLNLFSSIVHESNGIDIYSSVNPVIEGMNCLIVHEEASLPIGSTTQTVVDDPVFIDRAQGDYHLDAVNSPAIDFCSGFGAQPNYLDVDGQLRGWDDPSVVNINGAYDIGADESYGNDIIFQSGFDGV